MHYLLGYSVDHINVFLINLGLMGIARTNKYCIRQAQAITSDHLLQMATFLDFTKPIELMYWCLFFFAFFLFARK